MSGEKNRAGFWSSPWGALAGLVVIVGGLRGVWEIAVDLVVLAEEPPILSPEEAIRPTGGNPFGLRVKQQNPDKRIFMTFGHGMQAHGEPEYSSIRGAAGKVVCGWSRFDSRDTDRMNAASPDGGTAALIMPECLDYALKNPDPAQPPVTQLTDVTVGYFFRKIRQPALSMGEHPTKVVPIVEALHAGEVLLKGDRPRLRLVVGNPWEDSYRLGKSAAAVRFYKANELVAEMMLKQEHLDAVAAVGSNGTAEWTLEGDVPQKLKDANVGEVETRIAVTVRTKSDSKDYYRTMTTSKTPIDK